MRQDLVALEGLSWPPEAPFSMKTPFAVKTQTYHDGRWKGLALRSQGGSWTRTDPGGPGLEHFADSDLLARTPYLREIADELDCDKRSIRLLSLPAGAEVATHIDPYHGFKFGQLRLHCPIITHPDVEMYFDDRRYHWPAGELWYADFGRPHRVMNRSSITRVHLVLDVLISPALLRLFPADFVASQHRIGILMQETPVSLEQHQMQRFACDFRMPAALIQGILETDDGSVPGEVDCGIRFDGSQLVMFIE
jgi:aspartate beta-hydroxylase